MVGHSETIQTFGENSKAIYCSENYTSTNALYENSLLALNRAKEKKNVSVQLAEKKS